MKLLKQKLINKGDEVAELLEKKPDLRLYKQLLETVAPLIVK